MVTAGFKDPDPLELAVSRRDPDRQVVSNASQNELLNNQQVRVTPQADLRHLSVVQILTRPQQRHRAGPGAGPDEESPRA